MRTDLQAPKSYQAIMVSSTFADLKDHRKHVIEAIEKLGYRANVMEHDGARADIDVIDSSLQMVRDSAAYIGVISRRYGQTPVCPHRNPGRLSITELEFDEAMRLGRPILLFIMGENHPVTEADIELDPEKRNKLKVFRERAKRMHEGAEVNRVYEVFESVEQFSAAAATAVGRLAQYLGSSGYSALARLLAAVGDAITAFTDKVELIADCKTIHDHLHEMLQNVVRSLHDEVLPQWKQEGDMKPGNLNAFWHRLSRLSSEAGALKEILQGPNNKFKEDKSDLSAAIAHVLLTARKLYPEQQPELVREKFEEAFDIFVSAVKDAFVEAESRMRDEALQLHYLHNELNQKVSDVRPQLPLSPSEDDQLDRWLKGVETKFKELDASLDTHHAWQEIHHSIEEVEAFRDQSRFRSHLAGFCELKIGKLDQLVGRELKVLSGIAPGASAGGVADQTSCGDPRPNLRALRERLERLRNSKAVDDFNAILRPFDDSFYCVDKRTLDEVQDATRRIEKFKALRDELLRAHPMTSPIAAAAGRPR
jgi:hypothetical protein